METAATFNASSGTNITINGPVYGSGTLTSSSDYDIRGGVVEVTLAGDFGLVKTGDSVALLIGMFVSLLVPRFGRSLMR